MYLSSAIKSFHYIFPLYKHHFFRYIAIVRPLKPRMSKTFARVFLIVIWASSAMVSIPALLYSKTWTFTWVKLWHYSIQIDLIFTTGLFSVRNPYQNISNFLQKMALLVQVRFNYLHYRESLHKIVKWLAENTILFEVL